MFHLSLGLSLSLPSLRLLLSGVVILFPSKSHRRARPFSLLLLLFLIVGIETRCRFSLLQVVHGFLLHNAFVSW